MVSIEFVELIEKLNVILASVLLKVLESRRVVYIAKIRRTDVG